MSQIVVQLLKANFLRNARKNFLLKYIFGEHISIARVFQINIVLALLYFTFSSILPLIALHGFSFGLPSVESVAPSYHFVLNLILPIFLFFGFFVGAGLTFEMNTDENEQLLSFPVIIDDLVRYSLIDVTIANLKSQLYIFFPSFLCLYSFMGWSVGWVLLIAILSTMLALIAYLGGISLMLIVAKHLRNKNLMKICINTFLAVLMSMAVFIQMFKRGYIIEGETAVWAWLLGLLSSGSISVWVENMVLRDFGLPLYLLVISGCGLLIFSLWKTASKALYVMYYKIHISTDTKVIKTKSDSIGLTFEKLNSYLKFLPSFPRIILIKDILSTIRKPNLIIAVLILIGGLIFLTNMKFTAVANPLLFGLYYASMFVTSRLFLGAIGKERNNILTIRLLVPTVANYLSARIQMTIFASVVVLIPLWLILTVPTGNFAVLLGFYRLTFLMLNIILGSIFVTLFSAAFAEFEPSATEDAFTGINPISMLLYWALGFLVPIFFYNLDIAIHSGVFSLLSIVTLTSSGFLIFISMVLCYYYGIRRIQNYF